jgi:hypothetical protein
MENRFVIKRGYISQGDSSITGSLVVTGGITGSFSGSYVGDGSGLTGVGAFPFTGSALITGSLAVTGSLVATQIGVGATPDGTTRLDVRAQGALSTDIAFRVRNSADNADIFYINGLGYIDGTAIVSGTGDKNIFQTRANYNSANQNIGWRLDVTAGTNQSAYIEVDKTRILQEGSGKSGVFGRVVSSNTSTYFKGQVDTYNGIDYHWGNSGAAIGYFNILTSTAGARLDSRFWSWNKKSEASQPTSAGSINISSLTELMRLECKGGNLLIGGNTFGTNATRTIGIFSGVAPISSPVDSFQLYSADITAGNAAPHFRTENGAIIKLYQQSAVTSSQGLADVLTSVGLLATGSSIATAFERLSDFQSPYHYSGNATLGTSTSSTGWIINRIDFTTPGSPITLQGTGSWDNRTSLIYS